MGLLAAIGMWAALTVSGFALLALMQSIINDLPEFRDRKLPTPTDQD